MADPSLEHPQMAEAAMEYMSRVTLRGEESPRFNSVMKWLAGLSGTVPAAIDRGDHAVRISEMETSNVPISEPGTARPAD